MPTLALIMERTAAAFGLDGSGIHRTGSLVAAQARECFAWVAVDVCGHAVSRVGLALGRSDKTVENYVSGIRTLRRKDVEMLRRLDRLAVEILAEALAATRLKLPLPADPDPAHTAARLLAGGATAATLSEDALRGLALAFLAAASAAAGDPSPAQEVTTHG